MKIIKKWLFMRRLNKEIKSYGAKASIKKNILSITMRKSVTNVDYSYLHSLCSTDGRKISYIIQELKMLNIKEAYR